MFVSVLAAAVIDRVALGDRPVGFVITERGTAWMVTFVLGVAVINRVTTVRLTGRSWAALFDGPTITLVLGVGVLTATVGELPSGTLVQLSPLVFWGLFGVSLLGFIFVVSKWNNPIRFPEHAQHLRRLSRGPFAKAPTARDSQEAER